MHPPHVPPRLDAGFVAFGRARGAGGAALRARAAGVLATPGAAAVTPRRPRGAVAAAGRAGLAGVAGAAGVSGLVGLVGAGGGAARGAGMLEEWFVAAERGDVLGMVGLVRAGFDGVGAGERGSGRTALMCGAGLGREDVCACVFELARGVGGASVMYGHREGCVRELVEARDERGRNALHYAAMCFVGEGVGDGDLVGTVRRLVGYGVAVGGRDEEGLTPEELARKFGNDVAECAMREAMRGAGG